MARPSYLTLQNFRYGLDARRSELTSQPGTLLRAIDCHVNQGAEIEKRKAFVKTALPANTFGLLATPKGLMTFGSATPPVMPAGVLYQQLLSPHDVFTNCVPVIGMQVASNGQAWGSQGSGPAIGDNNYLVVPGDAIYGHTFLGTLATVPPGLVQGAYFNLFGFTGDYVVCNGKWLQSDFNPATNGFGIPLTYLFGDIATGGSNPGSGNLGYLYPYPNDPFAMLKVNAVCLFNGKPFVVATFVNGTWVFYDGGLVPDFFNGEVLANLNTNAQLATTLATIINSTAGYAATVNDTVVTVTSTNLADPTKSTTGDDFTIVDGNTTVAGTTTITPISNAVNAITGTSATASFTIIAIDATNGGQINGIYVGGGAVTGIYAGASTDVNLLAAAVVVAAGTSPAALATLIVNAINVNGAIAGVTAESSNSEVTITLPPSSSYNDTLLEVYSTGVCVDNCYIVINGGPAGNSTPLSLSAITVDPTGVNKNLITAGPILQGAGSTNDFAVAIVANINAHTATHGFTAALGKLLNNSAYIYISRAYAQSNLTALTVNVTFTGGGTVTTAITNTGFQATTNVKTATNVGYNTGTNAVTVKTTGGIGPYTYIWSYYGGDTGIRAIKPNNVSTAFINIALPTVNGQPVIAVTALGYLKAQFICTVTDTGNGGVIAVTPPINVTCITGKLASTTTKSPL